MSFLKRLFSTSPSHSCAGIIGSSLGASVAIALIAWVSGWVLDGKDVPLMVASMGAAAVLLFAAPGRPMAQPWPLLVGHLVSAIVGVSCAKYVPNPVFASALAVGGAIFCMHLSRLLHPPGGAAALVAVVGGDSIQQLGYLYVLAPVGLNVLIMLVAALVINNLIKPGSYPQLPWHEGR